VSSKIIARRSAPFMGRPLTAPLRSAHVGFRSAPGRFPLHSHALFVALCNVFENVDGFIDGISQLTYTDYRI